MPRLDSIRTLSAVSVLSLVASMAAAQESRIVVAPSNVIARANQLPITDAQVADLVARNFPETLHGTQSYQITLVVDANGNYVSGKTAKATIMTRAMLDSSGGTFIMRDSVAGGIAAVGAAVRRIRTDGDHENIATTGGGIVIARSSTPGEPHASFGMFGTDVRLEDISSMGMKKYDAGVLGDALIMVTVVQLK